MSLAAWRHLNTAPACIQHFAGLGINTSWSPRCCVGQQHPNLRSVVEVEFERSRQVKVETRTKDPGETKSSTTLISDPVIAPHCTAPSFPLRTPQGIQRERLSPAQPKLPSFTASKHCRPNDGGGKQHRNRYYSAVTSTCAKLELGSCCDPSATPKCPLHFTDKEPSTTKSPVCPPNGPM